MANKLWIGTDGNLTTAGNWSPSGTPAAGDNLRFPAGGGAISSNVTGLNNAALTGALGVVIFEEGYTGTVASGTTPMQFSASRFEFAGEAESWIDLEASAISPRIHNTASPDTGKRGLYLIGSALATVEVNGGALGLAVRQNTTATATTVRANPGSSVWMGSGATVTTFQVQGGNHLVRCALTTLTQYSGTVVTEEAGTITTVNLYGGKFIPGSSGTITTLHGIAGEIDFLEFAGAKTVTTFNWYPDRCAVAWNTEAVTLTTLALQRSGRTSGSPP